jgi:hypothetical protein
MKAILGQGWNPVNYNILTTLPEKDACNLTADGTSTVGKNTLGGMETAATMECFPKINTEKGTGIYYLDKLIKEGKNDEGR